MNKNPRTKLWSLVVLLVMLLNPIVTLASSLLLGNPMEDHKRIDAVQSLGVSAGMSENCHDDSTRKHSSEIEFERNSSECCYEHCECGQNGCHSLGVVFSVFGSAFDVSTPAFYSNARIYLSPALFFVNPPPIS